MSDEERLTLSEIRERYVDRDRPLPRAIEAQLKNDQRSGAQKLLAAIEKRRHKNRAEGQRLRHMLRFEGELWESGIAHVAGVDEAGMSPLAGPVVAGAVILPREHKIVGVDDSKKLDRETRERLVVEIKAQAIAWGVGIVTHDEIDRINIYRAGLLAMTRAVQALNVAPEALLIDARKLPELPLPQKAIIHGDALSLSIAAASIVAKTTRDGMMIELDAAHPGYGFARHKGYPVPEHYEALERLGACPIHRRSFGPVKKVLGLVPEQGELFS
jgi:ribonuclease HII